MARASTRKLAKELLTDAEYKAWCRMSPKLSASELKAGKRPGGRKAAPKKAASKTRDFNAGLVAKAASKKAAPKKKLKDGQAWAHPPGCEKVHTSMWNAPKGKVMTAREAECLMSPWEFKQWKKMSVAERKRRGLYHSQDSAHTFDDKGWMIDGMGGGDKEDLEPFYGIPGRTTLSNRRMFPYTSDADHKDNVWEEAWTWALSEELSEANAKKVAQEAKKGGDYIALAKKLQKAAPKKKAAPRRGKVKKPGADDPYVKHYQRAFGWSKKKATEFVTLLMQSPAFPDVGDDHYDWAIEVIEASHKTAPKSKKVKTKSGDEVSKKQANSSWRMAYEYLLAEGYSKSHAQDVASDAVGSLEYKSRLGKMSKKDAIIGAVDELLGLDLLDEDH
jgi:hypothetical protein